MTNSSWQLKLEKLFRLQGEFITRRPWVTLLFSLVCIGIATAEVPNIKFDGSVKGFLSADHPAVVSIDENAKHFGITDMIIVAVESENIFTPENLEKLQQLHNALLEEVKHVERVDSILNARTIRGEQDELLVEEFLNPIPSSQAELDVKRKQAIEHPLYQNLVISKDARLTTLLIKSSFKPNQAGIDKALTKICEDITAVVKRFQQDDFRILIGGTPSLSNSLRATMKREMPRFMGATLVGIAIFLFIMFRRTSGVLMPTVTLVFSVLCTLGMISWSGQPLQMPTMILPSFLVAVGVGDSVHLLAYFYRRFDETNDKSEAVIYALHHTGLPMLLTTLTTAAGLLSFAGAPILPVSNLGVFSALGIIVAFLLTVVLLPALICLFPLKSRTRQALAYKHGGVTRALRFFSTFAIQRAPWITAFTLLLLITAIGFASQLGFSHNPLKWLPEDYPIRAATETIDRVMGGSVSIDIIVDSGQPGGLKEPKLLNAIDRAMSKLENFESGAIKVSKVTGLPILMKELHRALHDNDPSFYLIPETRALVAQELLLFENSDSDDLETMVDFNYEKARIAMMIPWTDSVLYTDFIQTVESTFRAELGTMAKVEVSGVLPLLSQTLHAVIRTTAKSYAIALSIIAVMMCLLLSSIHYGLLSMIPNLLPITLVMAWMYIGQIPLDLFTMLVASVAIGITVDDTIHFMYNFVRDYRRHEDVDAAIHRTLQHAGRAMLVTTIVLSVGFMTFTASEIHNLSNFGKLTTFTIVLALVADFLVAPALLKVTHRSK
ncbi:MAG: MMPL family transporter [Deltaproteobacteria bacterium]|nr:MMPL family transporter [Deltaproteobacteria bacterium]